MLPLRTHVEETWLTVGTTAAGTAADLFLPEEVQAVCELLAACEVAGQCQDGLSSYLCQLDLRAVADGAPAADQGPGWDSENTAGAVPPLNGETIVPTDFAGTGEIAALAMLREILKGLIAGSVVASSSPRAARLPDPWVHAALKMAAGHGEDRTRTDDEELARAHRMLDEWTPSMDEDLIAFMEELAVRLEMTVLEMKPDEIEPSER